MKRPSFQFYPADWQANSNLRRCSHEEKGIWMDVLCLLHDQDEYGICRWTLKEIAQAIGSTPAKLKGLVSKGILKGADRGEACAGLTFTPRSGRKNGPEVTLIPSQEGPLWYSSRMVVDEYKRVIRGEYGAAPKGSPEDSPKGGIGEGIDAAPKGSPDPSPSRAGASSPSPSPATPRDKPSGISLVTPKRKPRTPKAPDYTDEFEAAWAAYPRRDGSNSKTEAYRQWNARLSEGVDAKAMMQGTWRYLKHCQASGKIETEYVMQAQRFYGRAREFENEWRVSDAQSGQHVASGQSGTGSDARKRAALDAAFGAGDLGVLEADFERVDGHAPDSAERGGVQDLECWPVRPQRA